MKKEYLELIAKAKILAKKKKHNQHCTTADVGSALLTSKGNLYVGVNLDASCGLGWCAENSAIAQMTTNQETSIAAIVAVNHNTKIIPPCGRCRELIYQINNSNLNTDIIISPTRVLKLKQLLQERWQDAW